MRIQSDEALSEIFWLKLMQNLQMNVQCTRNMGKMRISRNTFTLIHSLATYKMQFAVNKMFELAHHFFRSGDSNAMREIETEREQTNGYETEDEEEGESQGEEGEGQSQSEEDKGKGQEEGCSSQDQA